MKAHRINIALITIVILLLLYRMYLEINSFQGNGFIDIGRFLLVIISLIFLMFIQTKILYKILTITSYLIIVCFTGQLNLWKIGARDYIENNLELINSISENNGLDSIREFSIRIPYDSVQIRDNNSSQFKIDDAKFKSDLDSLHKKIGFYEIEYSKPFKMIILSRFIDNGYGLIRLSAEEEDLLYLNKRINGYQIKGISRITDDWFYIWFT